MGYHIKSDYLNTQTPPHLPSQTPRGIKRKKSLPNICLIYYCLIFNEKENGKKRRRKHKEKPSNFKILIRRFIRKKKHKKSMKNDLANNFKKQNLKHLTI